MCWRLQSELVWIRLTCLYERVDREALNRLVQGQDSFRVIFEYIGYEVTVFEAGYIAPYERGNRRPMSKE